MFVEKAIKDEEALIGGHGDLKSQQLKYRKELLTFCDTALIESLTDRGLLRPNEIRYEELKQALMDRDDCIANLGQRDIRHIRIVDDTPRKKSTSTPKSVPDNEPLSMVLKQINVLGNQMKNMLKPQKSQSKNSKSFKLKSAQPASNNSQSQQNHNGNTNSYQQRQQPANNSYRGGYQQQRQQQSGDFTPRSRYQNGFNQNKGGQYRTNQAKRFIPCIPECPIKKPHPIHKCERLQWFKRQNPLPPDANHDCHPNQNCMAKNEEGKYCVRKGHHTQFCPDYECKLKEDNEQQS